MFTSSACGAGGRIKPGVERSGTPGRWRNHTSSPRSGRQLFVIRHFMIIEIGPIAVARFAGWDDKPLSSQGLLLLIIALRMVNIFRMQATMATFFSLPFESNRW